MAVVFRECPLYIKTRSYYEHTMGKAFTNPLADFLELKLTNPLAPFGSSDYPFSNAGQFKGLLHAHLTQDISVVYRVGGRDPHVLDLYMIASHADLGTSRPSNPKKQAQVGKKLSQQVFNK